MQNHAIRPAASDEENRDVAARLRQAVQAAGGNRVVAVRAGVPLGTLNNYVGARTGMKMGALARLAAACNVSLEWLVGGEPQGLGSDEHAESRSPSAPPSGFSEPQAGLAPAPPGPGVDVALLAKAIEIVAAIDGVAWQDDVQLVAHRIASTYAVLAKPTAAVRR